MSILYNIIMLTYKVYFKVALLPEGVKTFRIEEEKGENELTSYYEFIECPEVFDKFLCTESQALFVYNDLNSVYELYNEDKITNLLFENNGQFTCKVTLIHDGWRESSDEEIEDYITELLWPADIHDSAIIFIHNKHYYLQLEINYMDCWIETEEEDEEEEEEESIKVGDCEFCKENDVEHRCINCDNKVCYPCRSRCTDCMNTLCPACGTDADICLYCIENKMLPDDEEEEEDKEEDDIEEKTYNGVYYADAMDMEAQMKEDSKWKKLREQWAKNVTDTESQLEK
jgi:hypothetical protein